MIFPCLLCGTFRLYSSFKPLPPVIAWTERFVADVTSLDRLIVLDDCRIRLCRIPGQKIPQGIEIRRSAVGKRRAVLVEPAAPSPT
jgi:hypothetical protein